MSLIYSCFFGISFLRKGGALQIQSNTKSSWSFISARASAGARGGDETLPRFQSADSSELLSAWSLAPVIWEQSSAQAGFIVSRKSRRDLSSSLASLASKAAVAGKGGSGRGCFRLMLEVFVELEENVEVLEVCQKTLYALVTFIELQVTSCWFSWGKRWRSQSG